MKKRKRTKAARSTSPTAAERIDREILAAAQASEQRASSSVLFDERKGTLVKFAQAYGVPDGNSLRLRGRRERCTVIHGRHITIDRDAAAALPADWRKRLCRTHRVFYPTQELEGLLKRQKKLPSRIRRFLSKSVTLTHDFTLKFEGASK